MAFRGWPAEAIELFEGLEADNSRAYWEDHKEIYERGVRAPLDALLAELAPEFGAGKPFRPYRDVRFSKDKSPYKTHAAARIGPYGYVALSAHGLTAGSGMVHLESDQLERYRTAVADDTAGPALEAAVAAVRAAGHQSAAHDALKTAPRGYPKDHPRIELLRGRGIIAWHDWAPAAWMGTAKAKDRIVDLLRAARPLTSWLAEHVGPPAEG